LALGSPAGLMPLAEFVFRNGGQPGVRMIDLGD
jgi:hypothetical protein